LPAGAAEMLRVYLNGDHLMLCAPMDGASTVYLLSIRHDRELWLDFAKLWPAS
jgi:hypothetical protein